MLKICAIIIIILSHAIPKAGTSPEVHVGIISMSNSTNNPQEFIAILLDYLGQIGNAIFIICSAWFLTNSKRINVEKIVYIVADCFFISVFMLALFSIFGYRFPLSQIIRQFVPTTVGNNWFVTCYLLFYAMHPLLNFALDSISKRTHLCMCFALVVLYCGVAVLKDNLLYFTKLVGFVVIFVLISYAKKCLLEFFNSKRLNLWISIISVSLLLLLILGTNWLGLRYEALNGNMLLWCKFWNPLILALAFGLFNLFRQLKFRSTVINYFSSLSLLVLCFHCNTLVMLYFRFDFFDYIYNTFTFENILLWIFAFAFLLGLFGFGAAALYRGLIQRHVKKVCSFCMNRIKKPLNKVLDYIVSIE